MESAVTIDAAIAVIVKYASKHELDSAAQDSVIATMMETSIHNEYFLSNRREIITKIYEGLDKWQPT